MDILTEKWYGGLPCFKMSPQLELTDVAQPRPLGVAAVAGQLKSSLALVCINLSHMGQSFIYSNLILYPCINQK